MLKEKDLEQFKSLLLALQARLRGDVNQLSTGALNGGQDSKSPTHMAELGTDAYEQDFSLTLMESEQNVLEEIHDALKRIDDGTYGLCEGCLADGKSHTKSSIPKTRLKVLPHARNCVECERKREELSA
ncbi:MAG: TraR/DksA family transcriptional regulator [Maioricimonas sp. JB049]